MKGFKKVFIASSMALMSLGANAEFVQGDWSNAGDNLTVVDTQSGIEWLSLTQTDGMSINQVKAELGSTFAGWRLPTAAEVDVMFGNFFVGYDLTGDNTSISSPSYQGVGSGFGLLFGETHTSYTWGYSQGIYLNDGYSDAGADSLISGSQYIRNGYTNAIIVNKFIFSDSLDATNEFYGVYLVSDGGTTLASINDPSINANNPNASVPLPASLGLLGLAMAGFGFRRKEA